MKKQQRPGLFYPSPPGLPVFAETVARDWAADPSFETRGETQAKGGIHMDYMEQEKMLLLLLQLMQLCLKEQKNLCKVQEVL